MRATLRIMRTKSRALVIPLVIGAIVALGGCNNDSPKSPTSDGSPEITLPVQPSRSVAPIESPAP